MSGWEQIGQIALDALGPLLVLVLAGVWRAGLRIIKRLDAAEGAAHELTEQLRERENEVRTRLADRDRALDERFMILSERVSRVETLMMQRPATGGYGLPPRWQPYGPDIVPGQTHDDPSH